MLIRLFLLSAILLLIAPGAPALSQGLDLMIREEPGFRIHYPRPLESVVHEVARMYPEVKDDLEKKLDRKVGFQPTIFLISHAPSFRDMTGGNELITAFAVPGNNSIFIDYSKMQRTPFDLELTLKHELCHLVLKAYIQKKPIPRWLNEGVSQWVSEGVADILYYDGDKILKRAVVSNTMLPLRDISRGFPRERTLLIQSYEQSRSIVEFIDDRYGEEKLLDILNHLQDGESIDRAIHTALAISLPRLEESWQKHLKTKYTWVRYVSDNIYWIVFFFGAVMTVFGFIHLRMRMRKYRDEEEEMDDIICGE